MPSAVLVADAELDVRVGGEPVGTVGAAWRRTSRPAAAEVPENSDGAVDVPGASVALEALKLEPSLSGSKTDGLVAAAMAVGSTVDMAVSPPSSLEVDDALIGTLPMTERALLSRSAWAIEAELLRVSESYSAAAALTLLRRDESQPELSHERLEHGEASERRTRTAAR